MLQTKRPEENSVIVMKLVTGEEIVARMIKDNNQTVTITRPVSVGMSANGQVAMMPFMVSLPDQANIDINMSNVILYTNAREEMKNAYITNTSNVVPATASDLQGIKANEQKAATGGGGVGGFKLHT